MTPSIPSGLGAPLSAALQWVDLAIFSEVQRMRARGRAMGADAPWGAFVGEAEVDEVLGELLDIGPYRADEALVEGLRNRLEDRRTRIHQLIAEAAAAEGPEDPLSRLVTAFGLTPTQVELLLLALAPRVNVRYLRLFAYLQDDFSFKALTPALALRLISDSRDDRLAIAAAFAPDSALIKSSLLQLFSPTGDSSQPTLARAVAVAPRIGRWLLQGSEWDRSFEPWCRMEQPAEGTLSVRKAVAEAVDGLLRALPDQSPGPVVHCEVGSRRDAIEAARQMALTLNAPLLVADLDVARRLGIDGEEVALPVAREARLHGAVLLLLDPDEARGAADPLGSIVLATEGSNKPLLVAGASPGAGEGLGLDRRFVRLCLPTLGFEERKRAWRAALAPLGEQAKASAKGKKGKKGKKSAQGETEEAPVSSLDVDSLARRYRFSPGQIDQILELASDLGAGRGRAIPAANDVLEACIGAFLPHPGPLAERVTTRRDWDDLVLPSDTESLLQELLHQVERREQVLEAIGASRVRAGEQGVKALFTGPPGTGKSLAAEVLAQRLGYPLFRVDLSSVVSKWVGETEKHLNRLFLAAEEAPCLLLFDEADALFGKRGEVKGAQDRFANLEVSYLLQRLESFDGVAILTTNLKRNIDEAFLRRFTFVVEFPFPEARERLRIWERMVTDRFPLAEDVSLVDVAREFKLAGANIWNVALAASVEASRSKDGRITREMLAHAVRREYEKLGREVAALRPTLLSAGDEELEADVPAGGKSKAKGKRALSAAEARRRRVGSETPEA